MTSFIRIPVAQRISKRSLPILTVVFCLLTLLLCPGETFSKPLKVLVLTDAAGLGDGGFNDASWKGVLKAKEDLGITAQFLQSREQADYVSNISMAAKNADIVVTLGYLFTEAAGQVASHFPDTRFIHIEGDVPGNNVASFDFKSEEAGFLAGVVAGLFTKECKVGIVTGMDIPPVEAYAAGFRAGVKTAEKIRKKSIETIVAPAGSFNDPVKGKSLAQTLIDSKVDVIFKAAGNTGIGVLEAVKGTQGVYLIGEDLDQDAVLPGRILTTALKRMDVAVYGAIRDTVEGKFKAGHRWLGAPDGAVGITDMQYTRQLFSPADLAAIEKARELLKQGKLTVPSRTAEVDQFQAPDL